jgi:hypothetical protein
MPHPGTINDRVRRIVTAAVQDGIDAADQAVFRSLLRELTEADVVPLLDEFFDVEMVTQGIFDEFVDRGREWDVGARERLAEALFFHGLDEDAERVQATLL